MNQADKDAAKWMEANAKWQERELYKAKDIGTLHYINQHGDVVAYDPKEVKDLLINIANQLEKKDDR